jgi:hypothetical protein
MAQKKHSDTVCSMQVQYYSTCLDTLQLLHRTKIPNHIPLTWFKKKLEQLVV